MEYRLAIFFLCLYYLRPQDWVPGMAGANVIKPVMAVWILVLATARSRPSPLPGLLRTPHDWVMLIYYAYVVWNAPDFQTALTGFFSLVAFYAFTVQSLTSVDQIQGYLKWWTALLVAIAILALLSLVGIDLTGAKVPTEFFRGRLSLGTWLANNPNALGHTVIAAIPLGYVMFFWKGTLSGRFLLFPLICLLAGYCAWRTESKGAFMVGGILIVLVFVIGRHRLVQITAITLALTVGMSVLSFLPRMTEMSNLSADEGVQGRLLAWEQARFVTKQRPTGEGWQQFVALIDWKDGIRIYRDIPKATHSSYVQVGGDLGKYGLFIYLAGLWTAFHTLLVLKTRSEMEERCRRALFVLVAGYALSGWMINRQYHTEYFLLIATVAALHRIRKGAEAAARAALSETEAVSSEEVPLPGTVLALTPPLPKIQNLLPLPGRPREAAAPRGLEGRKPLWNRLGLLDLIAVLTWTWITFWWWDYALRTMLVPR